MFAHQSQIQLAVAEIHQRGLRRAGIRKLARHIFGNHDILDVCILIIQHCRRQGDALIAAQAGCLERSWNSATAFPS